MTERRDGPHRRSAAASVVVVVLVLVVAALGLGCAGSSGPSSSPSTTGPGGGRGASSVVPSTGGGSTGEPGAPGATVRSADGTRTALAGFGEVTVTVVAADGTTRQVCLLLADTEALRERGLMYVEDPGLGGYDGMLFVFEEDVAGSFWMRNTRLPLSIAYVGADGSTTSTTDMAPCPDEVTDCPTYPSGGTYRYAVEVPEGELGQLGLSNRSRMTVGATTCAPATTGSVPGSTPGAGTARSA